MTQSRRPSRDGFIRGPSLDRSTHRAGRPPTAGHSRQRRVAEAHRRSNGSGRSSVSWRACLLIAVVAVGAVLAFRAMLHRTTSAPAILSGIPMPNRAASRSLYVDQQFVAGYQERLQALLAGSPGVYGVSVYDITAGTGIGVNQNTVFRAASVNKLELAVSLYRRALAHQIKLDATTIISEDDIQYYGTGTIQLEGPGQTYSFRELAKLMLQESDNTASYVIGRRLGLSSVQAEIATWGLKQTSMTENLTTPADVALLLARLQRRELLPEAQSAEILDLLQHTAWTDRLQTGAPDNLPVAHKIGTDVNVYNDAAVFLDPSRPYIVVVLSGGTEEDAALASMTGISKMAYQFETALPAATKRTR